MEVNEAAGRRTLWASVGPGPGPSSLTHRVVPISTGLHGSRTVCSCEDRPRRVGPDSTHPSPDLSIVVPAFNEEARLPASLRAISAYLAERPGLAVEVIVVDDGSFDRTASAAEGVAEELKLPLHVLRFPVNRGKGAVVRAGALAATGVHVLVTDADLSTPIGEWEKLHASGAPVAIGSRAVDRRLVRVRQPRPRELMGRLFNAVVQVVALPGIRDTQCGFKLFTREAAQAIFSRTTVNRFAWDVEALLLARKLGFPIAELGVLWFHNEDSRVSLRKGAQAYVEILSIRVRVDARLRRERKMRGDRRALSPTRARHPTQVR